MNTAVPVTRGGLRRSTSSRKRLSGNEPACITSFSIKRPFFHVLINVKTAMAIATGTQPPCSNLIAFAQNRDMSTNRNAAVNVPMCASDQFQRDRATT